MQSAEPLARTRTIESPQPAKAVASPWGGIPVAKKMRRCKIGADYARIENVHPCPSDSRGDALLINHVRVLNDVSIHAPPNSRGDAHRPRFTTWNRGVSIHAPEFEGRCVLVAGFDVAESRSFNPRPRIRGAMHRKAGEWGWSITFQSTPPEFEGRCRLP